MPRTLSIIGVGDQARVVLDILELSEPHATFVLVSDDIKDPPFKVPTLAWNQFLESQFKEGIVAIGHNGKRRKVVEEILDRFPNFEFVNAIHPQSVVSRHITLGVGNAIMAGAVVNPGVRIGNHCIINSQASIDHDGLLGDYSSIGPGAILGGSVCLGNGAIVALGAHIINSRTLGDHSLVGAGSVVTRNVEPYCVCYGVPAKAVRTRNELDTYF